MKRLLYRDTLKRAQYWMGLFGKVYEFDSDIGKGYWVRVQPNMAMVLSVKREAFFVQLLRNTKLRPSGHIKCAKGVSRQVQDQYPCIKHHLTIAKRDWEKRGSVHISIYDDGSSKSMKLLFDLYYQTCFPKGHRERINNPTNFKTRVLHIYFDVSPSGTDIAISRTHPETTCFVFMTREEFSKGIFEIVRSKYSRVHHSTLEKAWSLHEQVMRDVKTLMEMLGHMLLPLKK